MTLRGPLADRTRWSTEQCSIGKAMDIVGSRSAMLILREAFYGTTRFDDFAQRVGISDAAAATRLKSLVDNGILAKTPYREPGQRERHEYTLTAKGRDLLPAVLALMQWGNAYLQDEGGPLSVVDADTAEAVSVAPHTGAGEVDLDRMELRINPRWARPR